MEDRRELITVLVLLSMVHGLECAFLWRILSVLLEGRS